MSGSTFLQLTVTGVAVGAVYGLSAVGFALVYRASGLINLLQGEFIVVGGILAAVLLREGIPLPLAVAMSILVTAVFGAASYELVIRPVSRNSEGDSSTTKSVIIAQFALIMLLAGFMLAFVGTSPLTIPPFSGRQRITLFGAAIAPQQLWIICTLVVIVVGLQLFLSRTWSGRGMRAMSSNKVAAQLVGIKTRTVTRNVFVMSAVLGAVSGIVLTPSLAMQYDSGLPFAVRGFVGAVLGGFGSIPGALFGGLALGLLETHAAGAGAGRFRDLVVFAALIIVLLVRPNGLFTRGHRHYRRRATVDTDSTMVASSTALLQDTEALDAHTESPANGDRAIDYRTESLVEDSSP